jgi:hypothetical protein
MRATVVIFALTFLAESSALACEPTPAGHAPAVDSAETAIVSAKSAWSAQKPPLSTDYIRKFEPYHAVLEGEAWHVYGSLPGPGGTPEASVCRSNGATKVWHGQ